MANRDIHPSSRQKKLKDPEFGGWQPMHALRSNNKLWIYMSPSNLRTALINVETGNVLFIMDRITGQQIYEGPAAKKDARGTFSKHLLGWVPPKSLI